jgi:Holliday junction DNA helicase RuvA
MVQGVGYAVSIPLSTYERTGKTGESVTLHTYLHVREDILQLYGFSETEERDMFKLLLSVSGIGPRMALAVLSGVSVDSLRRHITVGDVGALTSIPGIGKKLAERLVVELREKVARGIPSIKTGRPGVPAEPDLRMEAILALTSLGYSRPVAERAILQAMADSDAAMTLEGIIKAALRTSVR